MQSMANKYHCDPEFRRLVDTLESVIHSARYTPSEIREAAVMASINYEMKHVGRTIYLDKETEGALKVLRDKVEKP